MGKPRFRGQLGTAACQACGTEFQKYLKWHRFCSEECQIKARKTPKVRRCKVCEAEFKVETQGDGNKWHCSIECATVSAKRSRAEFKKRNPQREPVYRATQKAKERRDTPTERLWRRYPWLPRACEACGEARVLDIAHRPEHKRNGAWALKINTAPDMVWILCPTCHALLDRLGYTPGQLGIKDRPPPPAVLPPKQARLTPEDWKNVYKRRSEKAKLHNVRKATPPGKQVPLFAEAA